MLTLPLNTEREYIQLHRDTTVQTLTLTPQMESGKLSYSDSPLIRAARLGRVLVLDEADKAPVEVVAVLKGLIADGELLLPDGRRLLSSKRFNLEMNYFKTSGEDNTKEKNHTEFDSVIPIHPDFRLIVLANRPGL